MKFSLLLVVAVALSFFIVSGISLRGIFAQNSNNGAKVTDAFGPRVALGLGTSSNWAGYAVETNLTSPDSNVVSDVKGAWVVPKLHCDGVSTDTFSATLIGIDGYDNSTVEQIGTEQDCVSGQPVYSAWYKLDPKPSVEITSLLVKPDDFVTAEVQFVKDKFVVTMTNLVTGQSFATTLKSNGSLRRSAVWITAAPANKGVLPLANFNQLSFSRASATIGNVTGSITSWPHDKITMTDSTGSAKVIPDVLSADGSGFNMAWNSN